MGGGGDNAHLNLSCDNCSDGESAKYQDLRAGAPIGVCNLIMPLMNWPHLKAKRYAGPSHSKCVPVSPLSINEAATVAVPHPMLVLEVWVVRRIVKSVICSQRCTPGMKESATMSEYGICSIQESVDPISCMIQMIDNATAALCQ